jgi:hypothetical protein
MKQLKRLNIKRSPALLHAIPKSGHRYINKLVRYKNKARFTLYLHKDKYKTRTFKTLTDALCLKFITILKYKAEIGF